MFIVVFIRYISCSPLINMYQYTFDSPSLKGLSGRKWYQSIGLSIVHYRYLIISNFIGPSPWIKRNTDEPKSMTKCLRFFKIKWLFAVDPFSGLSHTDIHVSGQWLYGKGLLA